MYVKIHDTQMYTFMLTKYRARKSFITKSFILNIKEFSRKSHLSYTQEGFITYVVFLLPANLN